MPFFILVCIMFLVSGKSTEYWSATIIPFSCPKCASLGKEMFPHKLWCFLFFVLLECGRTLHDRSGTFTSPGFPGSQKYKVCEWRIAMTPGERISLNFTSFGLRRGSSKCKDEYVEIRDGHSKSSPVIGKYCGKRKPPAIWSTGSRLWIQYFSHSVVGKTGFKATYKGERTFVHSHSV